MMKWIARIVTGVLLFMFTSTSAADKPEYAAARIASGMLLHADVVVRDFEREIRIEQLDKVVVKTHYVVTILNKAGEEYARCSESFSQLEKISRLYGYVYDKDGDLKFKIKESEFTPRQLTLNAGFYDDTKVMTFKPTAREYPYTIEYFTEKTQFHTFFLPEWWVRPDYNAAVEESSYTIITQPDVKLRYKAVNAEIEPKVSRLEGKKAYEWSIRNIAAERKEHLAREFFDGSPMVMATVAKFRLGAFYGDMTDWKNMGLFLYELNKNRDELTPEVKARVTELTSGLTDPHQKIAVLFKYMQEQTRYVSIQYGVGGWQTLDAVFVCKNQYGDCKALTNYMFAMLKHAGIVSYPVIIHAGRDGFYKMPHDFAVNVFNHAILCVPLGKDTVWLECTSRDLPSNYLGSFTADRDALMITPEGGVIVHTPRYASGENLVTRRAVGQCNEDGSITFKMSNSYAGISAEPNTDWNYMSEQQKDHYINSKLNFPSYTASDYTLLRKEMRGLLTFDENLSVSCTGLLVAAGSYRLLQMDFAPLAVSVEPEAGQRKKGFYLPLAYSVVDTFEVEIPANTSIDMLPSPVDSESPFGIYHLEIVKDGERLIATRSLRINDGYFKPEQYEEYEAWVGNLTNPAHTKVVLKLK